jgi:hypothetical protein
MLVVEIVHSTIKQLSNIEVYNGELSLPHVSLWTPQSDNQHLT